MEVVFKPEYKVDIESNIEIWVSLDSIGYHGRELSSFCKIRNRKGKLLKQNVCRGGYFYVGLKCRGPNNIFVNKRAKMHKLLIDTFLVKPESDKPLTCDHIDRNKINNNLHNLRWATARQQNLNRDPVVVKGMAINQLTVDGTFIRQWPSMRELLASDVNLYLNVNGVRGTLNGHSPTYRGYVWKYENSDLKDEVWQTHPDLGISVSDKGRVKKKNGIPTIGNLRCKQYVVTIEYQKYLVSSLVAETFYGIHKDQKVSHIDNNLTNNNKENIKFSGTTKTYIRPNVLANPTKIRGTPVLKIDPTTKEIIAYFVSAKEAAKILGIEYRTISEICNRNSQTARQGRYCGGYTWRYANHPSYKEKLECFQQPNKKRKLALNAGGEEEEITLKKIKYSK